MINNSAIGAQSRSQRCAEIGSARRFHSEAILYDPSGRRNRFTQKLIRDKLSHPIASKSLLAESVATILEHDLAATIQGWMELVSTTKS